jgi:hypothetical protein
MVVGSEADGSLANAHLSDDEAVAKMGHPNYFDDLKKTGNGKSEIRGFLSFARNDGGIGNSGEGSG